MTDKELQNTPSEETTQDVLPTNPVNVSVEQNKTQVTGATSQEVERLKGELHVATYVLLIGFAAIFVSVYLYFCDVMRERNRTYEELKVQTAQQNARIETLMDELNWYRTRVSKD